MDPMTSVPDPAERPEVPPDPSTQRDSLTPHDPSTQRDPSTSPDPSVPHDPSTPAASAAAQQPAHSGPPADPGPAAITEQPEPSAQTAPVQQEAPGGSVDSTPAPRLSDGSGLLGADGLRPVSARLIPSRYIAGIPGYVIGFAMVIAAIIVTAQTGWWWIALIGLLPLILVIQGLALTPRRARALGYLDGPEELTIASGILFREVSTIPYGRIQSVKIDEGPVDRHFGLAQLTMSTAAAGTTVSLPGLPKEEAERLRQLLTERGIEKMAAL